jgi:DNA-binding NarL/FixJ family response regulator
MSASTEPGLPADPVRVVVTDDHPLCRRGLVNILTAADIDVVAEAESGESAISAAEQEAPDVVLMDLKMPGLSGIGATRILIERRPATRVLVLTASAQEEDVTDAILAGACGYVLKDGPVEELIAAVHAVAGGQALISPRIASMLLQRIRKHAPPAPDGAPAHELSARELQVLSLLAAGKANSEIGQALFISPRTARNHVSNILTKLQVENRVQAAVRAVHDGILLPGPTERSGAAGVGT